MNHWLAADRFASDKASSGFSGSSMRLEELAAPYYVFKDAGAQITLTSPNRS
jgi:hypothetical protein